MGKSDSGSRAKPTNSAQPAYTKDEAYLQSVIPKRITLFESIQNEQKLKRMALSDEQIKITLPDGNVKAGKKWNTSPFDVAKEISKSLASNALIAKVNGVLWDMNRPLEEDCKLALFTFETDEGRDTFWHSSAHILGESLEQTYGCRLCIGPCTTRGEGFYYDGYYGDLGLNEDHFKQIESAAKKAVDEKQPFERIEVTRQQAIDMFSENPFKVEIIKDLPEDKTLTVYRCGPLVDLCRGPHIPSTAFVKAFSCSKASSAYWRGNKDRESLQRVYGISFPDQKRLKEHIAKLEEAKKYDHRELTKTQELFFFHPLSPGSCFFLPHGARVCNKLLKFIRSQYWKRGYEEVGTPNMYNMKLWEISGHAANYKENMFLFEVDEQEFGLKPMNCPGHCYIFKHIEILSVNIYNFTDLPLRLADFGVLHRNEASSALTGLTRVRRFQQDDAHIFCRESQIKDEVKGVLEFISYAYKVFGFTFELKLSTRPEKYLGDAETWERAEVALTAALNEFGRPWEVNEGDGAFYGPKIDISVSDALMRKLQCATLQVRDRIHDAGYYVDVDTTDRTINKKVREAQMAQYNYIVVVGEKEVGTGQVAVRVRDNNDATLKSIDDLLSQFKDEECKAMFEEAKKYVHRELTKKEEFSFFHSLSPGSRFFLPHGARVCNKLLEFIRSQYSKRGYEEVWTPNMYNKQLWERSGLASKYEKNMFVFKVENQEFGLKPVNCPGHCLIYNHRVRSYRELPIRIADFGVLHHNDPTGLTPERRFQQDDASIFCRESQIKDEVKGVFEFISCVYETLGFTFDLKLSKRPEKYLGDAKTWERAEAAVTEALNENGKTWEMSEGDGACCGPKIEISVFDAKIRKFQCAALQLDFELPANFKLIYSTEDETGETPPVRIHRSIIGSVEGMFDILLDHYNEKWPFWLSPRQAIVCPISDKSQSYVLEVRDLIHDAGYYVDVDTAARSIDEKVQDAQNAHYNYILIIGEKEVGSGQVTVRARDDNDVRMRSIEDLLDQFKNDAASFR